MVPLTEAAREAARQTHGEVLTYHGELVEAVYSSSSGGHTADNDAVWDGRPVPYLRGVTDPYDAASPHAQWQTTLSRPRLLTALSDHYELPVEGFYLGERSRDGRVQTVQLVQGDRVVQEIPSNAFRLLINRNFGQNRLKSTLFDVRRTGDTYVFEGRGFGHGVGLNQHGALEMSRQGFGYHDILAFYFTDVTIEQRGEAMRQPLVTKVPTNTPDKPARTTSRRRAGW
jgi:stage II sporulation protein D